MAYTTVYILVSLYMLFYPSAVSAEKPILNLVYTGAMEGELEPCGCSSKTDFGGMARFAGYLQDNKEELSPYILIDAGNFSGKDTPQGRLKTEAMLQAFKVMNYDAVALLGRENALSQEFLLPLTERYNTPAISGTKQYESSLLLEGRGVKLNISVNPDGYQKEMLNILLTDRSLSEASLFRGWDIIILSSGEVLEEPLRHDGTIILSGYPKGKRLGVLTVTRRNGDGWSYRHRWQLLGSNARESSAVRRIIEEYDRMVERLVNRVTATVTEGPYSGVLKCAECHQPFVESWEKTRHANALDSLKRVRKSGNPECLQCHTVGYGEPGGFINIEKTPALANVQCESCHGPGRKHITEYSQPMATVTENTCKRCHTKQNSPDFNYRNYLEKISHN
jgi:hypothetical protein